MTNNIKKIYKILSITILIAISVMTYKCTAEELNSEWKNSLYVPTQITKINDTYFIVDCYHNRIIYNNNLTDDISKWRTMTDNIKGGHSLASDGQVYISDDTENGLIKVFKREGENFIQTQVIENVTGRPHYAFYDEKTKYFYVLCSEIGKVWILKNTNGIIDMVKVITINDIDSTYVRSFNVIDGYMYFVTGHGEGYVYKVKYDDMSFSIIDKYKVPNDIAGMNFITKIDDYFYISTTTDSNWNTNMTFIRTKSLENLNRNDYEVLYSKFGFKCSPYYISNFDNKYFITEIGDPNSIKSFEVNDNTIANINNVYYFDKVIERK